jgi:hypothetical protein
MLLSYLSDFEDFFPEVKYVNSPCHTREIINQNTKLIIAVHRVKVSLIEF